jgi:hypothetical protein
MHVFRKTSRNVAVPPATLSQHAFPLVYQLDYHQSFGSSLRRSWCISRILAGVPPATKDLGVFGDFER